MKRLLTLLAVACCIGAGCGKKELPAPESADAPNPSNEATGTTPSSASTRGYGEGNRARPPEVKPAAPTVQNTPLTGVVHGFMTQQLRIFVQEKGRLPESFAEFTGARMDSVPFAPEGFEYAIDRATLEVKAVRKKR